MYEALGTPEEATPEDELSQASSEEYAPPATAAAAAAPGAQEDGGELEPGALLARRTRGPGERRDKTLQPKLADKAVQIRDELVIRRRSAFGRTTMDMPPRFHRD